VTTAERALARTGGGRAVVPHLPGVIDADEVASTGAWIASVQRPDGMIPWFEGGHCDPWNHVESAMALSVAGFHDEAVLAYRWLAESQLPEGSWFNYYLAGSGVKDPRLDTNVCAYVATGTWHHFCVTEDRRHLEAMWPVVEAALGFVLRFQREDGAVLWSADPDGRPGRYPLLTGSSSIYHALRCGVACAESLGHERPDWELAAGRIAHAIAHRPGAFEPKDEFAMDWYYPVLSGALEGDSALSRIDRSWDTFVMEGLGVRCVSTGPWVTAAETAECALALDCAGRRDEALKLLVWTRAHRHVDGSYWTGIVYPERTTFPYDERTTYTAAAVVLAADALSNCTAGAGLFRGESLPGELDLTEPRRFARPA
jgi:MMP endo-(1,4)-3-O-methyl-alpha-D-mannosidase